MRGDPFDLVPVDEVDVEFDVDLASGAFAVPPAPRVTVEAVLELLTLELLTGFLDWLTLDTEEAPLAAESHRSEENGVQGIITTCSATSTVTNTVDF